MSRDETGSAPDGFVRVREGALRALVRREHLEALRRLAAPSRDGRLLPGGRESHPLVPLEDGGWAVARAYRRGGAMRRLNRARYFLGHRAFEELRATEAARDAGVRVPEVIAAVERRRVPGYEALLATRWIEGAEELAGWLAARGRGPEREAVLRAAGSQVARLHDAGIGHPDLNLRNVLVAEDGVLLLDLDRARRYPRAVPPGRRGRDLRRLLRSARKLGVELDAADLAALAGGYGRDWPLG
jgi:3-deoxy-D-manno-octulosonic acid kinase